MNAWHEPFFERIALAIAETLVGLAIGGTLFGWWGAVPFAIAFCLATWWITE